MMKTIRAAVLAIILLTGSGWYTDISAQEPPPKTGELTVPWDEFKDLLDLGEDRVVVSMETFQKLLAQTGVRTTPPYTLQGGNVILSRAEFENLVSRMQPPVTPVDQLPFEFLITRAVYSGTMQNSSTAFSARFTVHVLKKDKYVKVPVIPSSTALQDIKVDGDPALLVSEGGYHYVLLSEPGAHEVVTSFAVRAPLDKGPHKIDLAIQPIPITLLSLEMPLRDVDVEIPQAQQVITTSSGGTTSVRAVLAQAGSISIRWRKKTEPTEKVPARLYAEVHHLLSIEDDALRVTSNLNLNILYSEMDGIRIAIPEGTHVLTVTGEGVGERQEATQDGEPVIVIPFTYGRKDAVTVRVTSELPLTESGLGNTFTGLRVLGAMRETGFIGTVLNTSAEVVVAESDEVEEIAVTRLPGQLVNQSAKPLTLGFKYLKHPYSVTLDVKKHDKIAVPMATINQANVVTLFTEDGKVVHRLVYQVRNSAKQFLEIQLPAGADVWSVFVDGGPVESSVSGESKLLVPLIRSRSEGGGLGTFPVEVIYCLGENRFGWMGSRESMLPAVDLMISQLIWSVYLPNDYAYHYFKSTLEKEEIIRGVNIFPRALRVYDEQAMQDAIDVEGKVKSSEMLRQAYKGESYGSSFRNIPMEEPQLASQMNAEMEFAGRMDKLAEQDAPSVAGGGGGTGILPIHIQVPTTGQVYRFAKTIVKPQDPLTFSVTYSRAWVADLLRWIFIVVLAWLVYINRRAVLKLWRWLAGQWGKARAQYKKNEKAITKVAQSPLTPIICIGLALVLWPVIRFLSLLAFFGFWVSAAYQVLNFLKKRAQTKTVRVKPPAKES